MTFNRHRAIAGGAASLTLHLQLYQLVTPPVKPLQPFLATIQHANEK
ncbi:hypothetical protein HW132_27375 [Brasilonema sp. CT11]|nr:hypothetical protein [Brasilonema sp. CT11]